MTRAEEIYNKAIRKARMAHERAVQEFLDCKRDWAPCGMNMERKAVIEAFDKALERS
jgi:hypothetical protein